MLSAIGAAVSAWCRSKCTATSGWQCCAHKAVDEHEWRDKPAAGEGQLTSGDGRAHPHQHQAANGLPRAGKDTQEGTHRHTHAATSGASWEMPNETEEGGVGKIQAHENVTRASKGLCTAAKSVSADTPEDRNLRLDEVVTPEILAALSKYGLRPSVDTSGQPMKLGEGLCSHVIYLEYTDAPPGSHPEDRPRWAAKFAKLPSCPEFAFEGFQTVRKAANRWKAECATNATETAPPGHPPICPPASWMTSGLKELLDEWSGWPPAVLPFHSMHIDVHTAARGAEGRTVVLMPLMEGTWEDIQRGSLTCDELLSHFSAALRGLHWFQERDISIFDIKRDNMGLFKGHTVYFDFDSAVEKDSPRIAVLTEKGCTSFVEQLVEWWKLANTFFKAYKAASVREGSEWKDGIALLKQVQKPLSAPAAGDVSEGPVDLLKLAAILECRS
ncbi:unnamed protein product [Vitrella brassicaformis CCMP3155]|uniref:Uncharacterized protein n=1 Tax=Vitrella brassicaformis (strain CCMP3155) TaxID=1169540 RepID=A0A0G4EBK0_VITBC|nr:unnamed protein product [Vitrella brassicaformis CCMP3155]|eukprot:CEL92664.1 unnamed protein product [Vitrella brassicaformis CCMP3155]